MTFDALVLAGAHSRRLGGADKAGVVVGGRTLLDAVLDATQGAARVIVVGPQRPTAVPVLWRQEEPAGGGPVAGIAAGIDAVGSPWCLLLATDLPHIGGAVPLLLAAAADAEVAALERDGRRNHLAAVWRTDALRAALGRLDSPWGAPAHALYEGVHAVAVHDDNDWGRDVNTWDDVEQVRHG